MTLSCCSAFCAITCRLPAASFPLVDDPLYPPAALREAPANVLCHRDFSIVSGAVTIAIFDDQLKISSAGELHFGLTPGDLLRPIVPALESTYSTNLLPQWNHRSMGAWQSEDGRVDGTGRATGTGN